MGGWQSKRMGFGWDGGSESRWAVRAVSTVGWDGGSEGRWAVQAVSKVGRVFWFSVDSVSVSVLQCRWCISIRARIVSGGHRSWSSSSSQRARRMSHPHDAPIKRISIVIKVDEHLTPTRIWARGGEGDGSFCIADLDRIVLDLIFSPFLIHVWVSRDTPLHNKARNHAVKPAVVKVPRLY